MLGLRPTLTTGETIAWLAYVVPMSLYVFGPTRRPRVGKQTVSLEGSIA